jgi:hypothetical protein
MFRATGQDRQQVRPDGESMLTSAIPLQDVDPALLPLPGLISDTDAPDCDEAVPWRAVPVSRALAWGDEAALLLRERARLGPVFRRGERVILLDPAFNRLVLDDDGALFPRAEPGGALALDTAVLERVLAAELARWREGTIRFQPAMAMALARALVPAVTGLAPGSGAAERLANALSTLDEGRSLLRRAMPRGLPSSPIGARQALAQGCALPVPMRRGWSTACRRATPWRCARSARWCAIWPIRPTGRTRYAPKCAARIACQRLRGGDRRAGWPARTGRHGHLRGLAADARASAGGAPPAGAAGNRCAPAGGGHARRDQPGGHPR